jgi:hypothetical protein
LRIGVTALAARDIDLVGTYCDGLLGLGEIERNGDTCDPV